LVTGLTAKRTLSNVAFENAKDELTDYVFYTELSESERKKNSSFKRILARLADMEYAHYKFWSTYNSEKPSVNSLKIRVMKLLRRVLGITFTLRYLEKNELKSVNKYREVASLLPPTGKRGLGQIIRDEEQHARAFNRNFKGRINYISFIVLGLADALVEIAGIHAGALGIYNSTEVAGLAGIVAGAAASIAMASAAYAQAKTGFKGSAAVSAIYTGISYFLAAVFLATPYFLTRIMLTALTISLAVGVVLIGIITFFGSVISGTVFKRDFVEVTAIMFGAAGTLYLLGLAIRHFTGLVMP
jgi:VIT1/CCC1 family predicted Fe2+/Mn2+ transporter